MCRIFGHFGGPPLPAVVLERVADAQRHGGPDAQRFVNTPGWSLGTNRLAIQGLEGGEQPYSFAGGIHVAFNGEIYNHGELRRLLATHDYPPLDRCDGSVLAPLYHLLGEEFVEYLDGMFALAVIDCRHGERLLLAADGAGMKSVYYYRSPLDGALCFASELGALFRFPGVPRELRAEAIDSFLTTRAVCGPESAFQGVYSLPPGGMLRYSSGREPELRSFATRVQVAPPPEDLHAAGGMLRTILEEEVSQLVRADVPVGVVVSGGLDSSLITALAARVKPGLPSFHLCYRGRWPDDERRFARAAAARAGADYHEIELDPRELPELLVAAVRHLGQPNAAPHALSTLGLCRGIAAAGVRVALAGEGADEFFGGYERFRLGVEDPPPWVDRYLDLFGPFPQSLKWQLYAPAFTALLGGGLDRAREMAVALELDRSLPNILRFDQAERFPAYILRRTDHLSMAAAVEVRLPFCQSRVRSFAAQSPDRLKISAGRVKRVVYEAAAGLVPPAIMNRKKQPFTLPIVAMLAPGQPIFELIRDILTSSRCRQRGIFRGEAVLDLLRRQVESPESGTANALWCLGVIEVWCREFLDNR